LYIPDRSATNSHVFSWSLIYEKHRRFALRPGRAALKSDTGNTKKGVPFVGSPRLIIFVL